MKEALSEVMSQFYTDGVPTDAIGRQGRFPEVRNCEIVTTEFIERETEVAPDRKSLVLKSRPDGSCVYLTDDNLCRINSVKPEKCRTFPSEWSNPDSAEVCPALAKEKREGK